jgi:glycosyltransferase involved in cell wall biosynthesis
MILTVAIPTYDRNAILLENIQNLLPQLTQDCELLILDNCSPVSVAETLEPVLSRWPSVNWRIARNRVNIGGAANILKCFEQSKGKWLWCLGDDDTIAMDAVATIMNDARNLPDAALIHYSSSVDEHASNITVRGIDGFTNSTISFNGMMFMSAIVYNVSKVISSLYLGYLYAYSWGPQLAMILSSLSEREMCEIRSYRVVTSHIGAGKANMWTPVGHLTGRQALLELPMSDRARAGLAAKMSKRPSVEYIACEMVLRGKESKNVREMLYLYDQMCYKNCYFERNLLVIARWRCYRWLVKWPGLGYGLVRLVYKVFARVPFLARNKLEGLAARDRFYRA